jgi:dTDP-4-dehydrorhamnose 3,5-epimerase
MIETAAPAWLLEDAVKDRQTITARWSPSALRLIDGVAVHEVLHVPKSQGYLTEVFRADWLHGTNVTVDQVFQVVLEAGGISAWHAHERTIDRIFVNRGMMRLVLYDAREESPTRGLVNELRFGTVRPALVIIPPRVWHGIQNLASAESSVLNLVDRAYAYDDPDHWRVPVNSPQIPFSF